ncbi:MAG: hypothetical protein R3B47_02895 [Bacteroidia bacterium]
MAASRSVRQTGLRWLWTATTRKAYNSNASAATLRLQRRGGDLTLCEGNGNIMVGTGLAQARIHIPQGYDAALGSYNTSGYLMLGAINNLNLIFDNNDYGPKRRIEC